MYVYVPTFKLKNKIIFELVYHLMFEVVQGFLLRKNKNYLLLIMVIYL